MMIVGLTGGIGSGKSTVAKMFVELGIPVYDSDMEAKELMVGSSEVKNAITELLGEEAYDNQGLNRPYIADKVFKDPELLEKLNAIVHPAVRKHFLDWVERQESPYVIQETALIFENDAQDKYDYTILVTAPVETRIQRVIDRDNVEGQAVVDRMKNQLDDEQKVDLANFSLKNLELNKTRRKVKELHLKLLALSSKF
ncbi:dephospho-CoA kinase [Flagellimonas lutimaris]|uniref:Dephospho-CoA kinase n=1 Tax=Flagellimonas lutimaris TaxID=475082 RepID=A0A3A1N676_9FLAO|nr:dephospho-CoA kinase [Allomuricauda lutimaris]RIV32938.1 dephospho-CoA kinase [Allomuricauda lutimaris]